MVPLSELQVIENPIVFCDIDDTLTIDGRLVCEAYESLWKLFNQGVPVIPVTGRPAGWCEMIARTWPVHGVIGENGALFYRYADSKMHRNYVYQPNLNRSKLDKICAEIVKEVPGTAVASDQFCRLFDLAIDFCEDVEPLSAEDVQKIVSVFQRHGATAKVSSIHVNGWFGDHDKLKMTTKYLHEYFSLSAEEIQKRCVFVGDSPNDEPMFGFFRNSVGVANITEFAGQLQSPPKFVTSSRGGFGFKELVEKIQ